MSTQDSRTPFFSWWHVVDIARVAVIIGLLVTLRLLSGHVQDALTQFGRSHVAGHQARGLAMAAALYLGAVLPYGLLWLRTQTWSLARIPGLLWFALYGLCFALPPNSRYQQASNDFHEYEVALANAPAHLTVAMVVTVGIWMLSARRAQRLDERRIDERIAKMEAAEEQARADEQEQSRARKAMKAGQRERDAQARRETDRAAGLARQAALRDQQQNAPSRDRATERSSEDEG